ncbi:hypothetical protein CVT25_012818 [Psilocybe cyanescens]|uniref:Uncharacterized protein n=1 Tax=Psilocybe cyanescens TaxID=93625 RepID=A0A409XF74_PSICY|nr:hypothetical protein CVT25_012818 [Psilocybe cyanescens]
MADFSTFKVVLCDPDDGVSTLTSSRVPPLPTNLKERIAAIEQKVGNAGPSSRSVSPAPGAAPTAPTNAGALRDKIAKFEGKGGIPVPRSRFGLGAPPTTQAPQRNGELYGNRIPAPSRSVSNGVYPSSRAASPTGELTSPGDRRSVSLSSVASDFDDHMDYTPVGSPTFAFPLDSPESVLSMPNSPEVSSSLGANGNGATLSKNIGIVRATSFQKALEIARNAESAKLEALDPAVASILRPPQLLDEDEDVEVSVPEPTPVIVVSSEEAEPVVVHESPTLEATPPSVVPEPVEESTRQDAPPDTSLSQSQPSHETVEAEVTMPTAPAIAPPIVEETTQVQQPKESAPVVPVILPVTPLTVRKRRATISRQETETIPSEPVPELPIAAVQAIAPLPEVLDLASPPTVIAGKSDTPPCSTSPQVEIPQTDTSKPDAAISEPPRVDITEEVIKLPPPEIVVHNARPVSNAVSSQEIIAESQQNDFNSRDAGLTLDASLINSESLMSPPLATGMSLTDVLSNYFTGGLATGEESKFGDMATTIIPPLPSSSPLSPPARLAYDSPVSPQEMSSLPVPAARPRNKTPEPLHFLSPPASGVLSTSPSAAGSSMGSMSTTLSSRPMSMIETSPSRVTRAMRMTPATGRGVPMFLPPPSSAQPRKSDFVYFPPTPDAEESEFGEMRGTGSGTMHKSSQSLSEGTRTGSEPDVFEGGVNTAAMFTAVVHGKVREASAAATMPSTRRYVVPATPQMKRVQRQTMAEPPLSPGQGELAALLQEAMWLEDTLSKGELPTEIVQQNEVDERERVELESIAEEKMEKTRTAKEEEEEERRRIAQATVQLQAKRHEPTSGKLKHTFLIPLAKARSVHRSEGSTSSKAESFPSQRAEEEALHSKSAGVPDKSAARATKTPLPTAGPSQSQIEQPETPLTPENLDTAHPGAELPTKSPKSSRFASFRRLGSISRPSTMYGSSSSVRHSNSTSSEISSEDSQAVATPPEAHLEFGALKYLPANGEYGHGNGSTTSFPSLSPKKSGNNLGRAASFAEKMWSRARTKSSTSTLSVAASELTVDDVPRLPAFGTPPALEISLPSVPVVVPPSPERKSSLVLQPPKRSTSLRRSANLPPIPTEPVPPMPPIPTVFQSHTQAPSDLPVLEISSDSLFPPGSADSSRPKSWTSLSSAGSLGSLPSPLFDKEFFDAFPSVPGSIPMPEITTVANFPHQRNGSTSSSVFANPSFDSALLSSAIHLASAHKSAAAPSTTTLHQQHVNVNGATPTPVSVSLPRRSGESAR